MEGTRIAVVRHGEKIKNAAGVEVLTLKGMKQIMATCGMLKKYLVPGAIFFSGAERTLQCATVAQIFLGLPCAINMHSGLHFEKIYNETLGGDYGVFTKEFNAIKEAGNTIAVGLKMSEYVRQARGQMIATVIEIAQGGNAIGFSHSPISSFASPDTNFAYDIGLADAIVYEVSDGGIASAQHLACPL